MLEDLTTRIFADGADLAGILALANDPMIAGFTTNPTLMRQAGVPDYAGFAKTLLAEVSEHPVSFEVFADEPREIRRQARVIASWGSNVYVKVPITTTKGEPLLDLVRDLSEDGIKVNVTALFTPAQVEAVTEAIRNGAPSYQSVFAGRIADAGFDPVPIMAQCLSCVKSCANSELIWASPREIFNLVQANAIGCHIITMTHDLLKKVGSIGKDLATFSLETVQMFHRDAEAAGYLL